MMTYTRREHRWARAIGGQGLWYISLIATALMVAFAFAAKQ